MGLVAVRRPGLLIPDAEAGLVGFHALSSRVFAPMGKGNAITLHASHIAKAVKSAVGVYGTGDYGGTTTASGMPINATAASIALLFTKWVNNNGWTWGYSSGGDQYAFIRATSNTTIVVSISNNDFGASPATRTYTVDDVTRATFVLVWGGGLSFSAWFGGVKLTPTSSSDASTPSYLRGAEHFCRTNDFHNGSGGLSAIARWNTRISGSLAARVSEDIYSLLLRRALRPFAVGGGATSTYTYSGSGSITFSGAATLAKTRGYLGSGSVTFSGAAGLDKIKAFAGSGTLTLSGTATTATASLHSYAGSGTLTYSGAATTATSAIYGYSGAGALSYAGAATTSYTIGGGTTYSYSGSGTVTLSGTGTTGWLRLFSFAGSGSIVFAGAGTSALLRLFSYAGGGSVTFSGAAATVYTPQGVSTYAYDGSGSVVFDGAATTAYIWNGSFTTAQLAEILTYVEANLMIWDEPIEGVMTAREMMRILLAAIAGKRAGLGTATEQYMAQDGTTPRVTFTPTDANGNGSTVLDGA